MITIAKVSNTASRVEATMNVEFSDKTEYKITVKEGTGKSLKIQYKNQVGVWVTTEEYV